MIAQYLGIDTDYVVIGPAAIVLILIVLLIVVLVQMHNLKKNYGIFMSGRSAHSLEDVLVKRFNQVDDLIAANAVNEAKANQVIDMMSTSFQKCGLVKYNAFEESGGRMSFSLALLDAKNNGFVMNAVHSTEGCYTYLKEIVAGRSILTLAKEEQEALARAKGEKTKAKAEKAGEENAADEKSAKEKPVREKSSKAKKTKKTERVKHQPVEAETQEISEPEELE